MGLPLTYLPRWLRHPGGTPGDAPDALSTRVETLLRAQSRLEAPDALRHRLLAAYARGERTARPFRALSPVWFGGLAAAAVAVAILPAFGSRPDALGAQGVVAAASPLRIRLVDDPTLGMGHAKPDLGVDALLADSDENDAYGNDASETEGP